MNHRAISSLRTRTKPAVARKTRILAFAVFAWLTSLFAGCSTLPFARRHCEPAPRDLIEYPVVDIHTHTFNARYLPLEEIIRARREEMPALQRVREETLLKVGRALISFTPGDFEESRRTSTRTMAELEAMARSRGESVTPLQALTRGEASPDDADIRSQRTNPSRSSAASPDEKVLPSAADLNLFIQGLMPEEKRVSGRITWATVRSIARFVGFVTNGEKQTMHELPRHEFGGRVNLFVHHTMDLGPVFDQPANGRKFLDFESRQLPRARRIDKESGGQFIHFVAWNPFRQPNDPNLDDPEPLRLVREAVEKGGAWGVKFYPSSGYRPSENDLATAAPRPSSRALLKQWHHRYDGMDDKKLNDLNERLFEYCEKNNVPIFVHCHTGEFTAAKEYGRNMAHPMYWRSVVENHKKLRLCLGHAGGPSHWFESIFDPGSSDAEWGREVYRLVTENENVYCEFGVLDQILQPAKRRRFVRRVARAIRDSNGKFGQRIMFGSDWFMPTLAEPRTCYLDEYRRAFLTEELRPYYKEFFCRNALRYLRLEERMKDVPNVTPAMRQHFRALIARSSE